MCNQQQQHQQATESTLGKRVPIQEEQEQPEQFESYAKKPCRSTRSTRQEEGFQLDYRLVGQEPCGVEYPEKSYREVNLVFPEGNTLKIVVCFPTPEDVTQWEDIYDEISPEIYDSNNRGCEYLEIGEECIPHSNQECYSAEYMNWFIYQES